MLRIIFVKLKSLILLILNAVNKALCCFRRKRCEDNVVLTHVGVVSNRDGVPDMVSWSDWADDNEIREPKTIQDHIDIYRKQKVVAQQKQEENDESVLNFFEDMAPKITKQSMHVIQQQSEMNESSHRLNFEENNFPSVGMKELGEWEETPGWEGEILDWDAQQALREKKRLDRERKALEKHQKRQEKMNRSLGARVTIEVFQAEKKMGVNSQWMNYLNVRERV